MGYLIHTLLHFLVGASLFYVICNKDYKTKWKRVVLFLFGGAAGVFPDVTKFFGDIFGHSILLAPLIGLLSAIGYRLLLKDISLKKLWFAFSITVLFGHLFIDYIGNGVAFLYPFVQKEFDFHIVRSSDNIIIFTLLLAFVTGIFYQKGKWIVLSGLVAVSLYLGVLSFSKIQLQQTLKNEYQGDNITLLITYPRYDNQWAFQVRTNEASIIGYAPIFGNEFYIERESKR
jgi:hypothetical protein